MWHHFALLPIRSRKHVVSMGEGNTPLVPGKRLGTAHGFAELRCKNETANPTGSFKDRQLAVGVSHAVQQGQDTIAVVSSGNVACAAAAYAARAGLRCVVFAHAHAGLSKLVQAATYGATVLRIDSPAPSAVFDVCRAACARWNWRHLSTAGMYDPYTVEGSKTIAYELWRQYKGELPEWIVAPVGGGGLLGGVWRGLLDLQRLGLIDTLPRLVGVQATGCAPLKRALDGGESFLQSLQTPWPDPDTIAGGIADDILFDGHTVLPALRTTNGLVLAVTDPAIEAGVHTLARTEGILCEITCAVVVAALEQLAPHAQGERVCALITGSGIKDLAGRVAEGESLPVLDARLDAVAEFLDRG
jgi:threonine synthase